LGISSLERVELLIAIEKQFGVSVDETAYANAATLADLQLLTNNPDRVPSEPARFPSWNRSRWARLVRRVNLPLWILPLARVFARVRAHGVNNLHDLQPPVIFAVNHQSHLDVPALMLALPSRFRFLIAPAMSKEFFHAHFHPEHHTRREWFTNSLNYYLGALLFNAFPLPQREAGAKQFMHYAGQLTSEGWCIVIFPEGRIADTGEISTFQPGVGLLAARLHVPVVPVRLFGLDQVLHRTWKMARSGRVEVVFGTPLHLEGTNYAELARLVETAVRSLNPISPPSAAEQGR
jgi:long-chain acyl-CoA synthetase